jgi:anti-sigma B factor antagonist
MQPLTRELRDGLLSVVSTHYGDEVTIVSLVGELDLAVASTAAAAIEDALADKARRLVLDLQGLEFLDTSGIAMLSRVAAKEVSEGDVLVIPSDSPGVSRILTVTGVDSLLRFTAEPGRRLPVTPQPA